MFSIPGSGGHELGTWSVVAGEEEVVEEVVLVLVLGFESGLVLISIFIPEAGSITSCVMVEPRSEWMKCSMRRIRATGTRIPQRPYRAGRGIV
jgi:hypothetical protein